MRKIDEMYKEGGKVEGLVVKECPFDIPAENQL